MVGCLHLRRYYETWLRYVRVAGYFGLVAAGLLYMRCFFIAFLRKVVAFACWVGFHDKVHGGHECIISYK
jgi:hypothetical protein